MSYYIIKIMVNISITYQASVLYNLIMKDLNDTKKYYAFMKSLSKEELLQDTYKKFQINDKIRKIIFVNI